jgi:hypothetical protein
MIKPKKHYHAPRHELITQTINQLIGDREEDGHYITIWAPRQTGKTTIMHQVVAQIKQRKDVHVGMISLQSAKNDKTDADVFNTLLYELAITFQKNFKPIKEWKDLSKLFSKDFFDKPLILIIDEFDALDEVFINQFANEFRNIYLRRQGQSEFKSDEKSCLLHGLALIGVRSVLGIGDIKGSPFNVQRSVHIPNLLSSEVKHMFNWYEKETRQTIEPEVIDSIYYEFRGQPGLTCWFGELLTEQYNTDPSQAITKKHFDFVYSEAINVLPNNNILNIISKVKQPPYHHFVLKLFQTNEKILFKYDNDPINYLYMNGVIDIEKDGLNKFVRFSSPFVQKRLFSHFAERLFDEPGQLVAPFTRIDHVITKDSLNIKNLMRLYETYLHKNKNWLLKDAPRRKDLRIFEAVYHFSLYMYLYRFLENKKCQVWPEFPTGNGKIDLLIQYASKLYGIELKSYTDESAYYAAIDQAADYAQQLKTDQISLVFFVDAIDDSIRNKYEIEHIAPDTGVKVEIIFIACEELGK